MMDILILGGLLEINYHIYQLSIFLMLLGISIGIVPFFKRFDKNFCKNCLYSIGVSVFLLGSSFYEIRETKINADSGEIHLKSKTIFKEQNITYDLDDLKLFAVEKGKTSNSLDTYFVSMKIDEDFIPIQEIRQNQTGLASDDVEILNTWLKKYGNPEPMVKK